MTWFAVYLIGLVLAVFIFYYGGVRGGSRSPEIWSLVFGMFWPVTIPLLVYMVFKKDTKGKS